MSRKTNGGARPEKKPKRANPDVAIEIDGKRYTLRYSLLALSVLQDHYGLESLGAVGEKLDALANKGFGWRDLVAVFRAGLATHHGDLEEAAVLRMLDSLGMGGVEQIIEGAFNAAMPEPETAGEGPTMPPPGPSTR